MYYVTTPDRVRGALRSTVYNNTIVIDSVHYMHSAVRKALDTFSDWEFQSDGPA